MRLGHLAHRHPTALALGAVLVGAAVGWVARGALTATGSHTLGKAPEPEPAVRPERATRPAGGTGHPAPPPVTHAKPAVVPGGVRGGNVADMGWNDGATRSGPA